MSAWVECAHCTKKKLVEVEPQEGDEFFCNAKCQKKHKNSLPRLGPKTTVGSRSTTARSKREAKVLDKIVGGKVVRGSGAIKGLEGDRLSELTMFEEKVTDDNLFILTTTDWEKLQREAGGGFYALLLTMQGRRTVLMPLDQALHRLDPAGDWGLRATPGTFSRFRSYTLYVSRWDHLLGVAYTTKKPAVDRFYMAGHHIMMLSLDEVMTRLEGKF